MMKSVVQILAEDNGYLAKSENVSLFNVDLMGCKPEQLGQLLENLRLNRNIKSLSFSSCNFYKYEKSVFQKIFEVVNTLSTLEIISFSDNFPEGFENIENFNYMASMLKPVSLVAIDLSSNYFFHFGSRSLDFLEVIFRNNPGLKKINLRGNEIGNLSQKDFERFCNILKKQRLEHVDLFANNLGQISRISFEQLFNDLSEMHSLKYLNIGYNCFSERPLSVISDFLEKSQVEVLDFSSCDLGMMEAESEDWERLCRTVSRRNCIQVLKISYNHLDSIDFDDYQDDELERINLVDFFTSCLQQWTILKKIDVANNSLFRYDAALELLARTMLVRNPGLGFHSKFSTPEIVRDFINTGYEFDIEELIQKSQRLIKEQKIRSEQSRLLPSFNLFTIESSLLPMDSSTVEQPKDCAENHESTAKKCL